MGPFLGGRCFFWVTSEDTAELLPSWDTSGSSLNPPCSPFGV